MSSSDAQPSTSRQCSNVQCCQISARTGTLGAASTSVSQKMSLASEPVDINYEGEKGKYTSPDAHNGIINYMTGHIEQFLSNFIGRPSDVTAGLSAMDIGDASRSRSKYLHQLVCFFNQFYTTSSLIRTRFSNASQTENSKCWSLSLTMFTAYDSRATT